MTGFWPRVPNRFSFNIILILNNFVGKEMSDSLQIFTIVYSIIKDIK
jgi:hypothetical protein